MGYEANRRVETSARTFAIVERLARTGATGVSALADDLGMSKGIAHNHLSTLRELGYVTKVGDRYRLSPKLLHEGFRARAESPLYRYGEGLVADLADGFETVAFLAQRAGDDAVVIDVHGHRVGVDLEVGRAVPLVASAVGVATLFADGDSADDVDGSGYDVGAIETALAEQGYAVAPFTRDDPWPCLAAPIADDEGAVRGCLGVALSDDDGEDRRARIAEAVRSLRGQILDRLRYGWSEERSFATEKHSWIGD